MTQGDTDAQLTKSKEQIIRKAEELAIEYEAVYKGCAQSTFMAITGALRWGGVDIVPEEIEDRLYPGLCQLAAGIAITGEGSGAVTASALAIGMALAVMHGIIGKDASTVGDACEIVRREILDKFYDTYNSQRCVDIQLKRFGKAWDFRKPEMSDEFLSITDGCAVKEGSGWAVAAIVDELEQYTQKLSLG
ncbi:MAG: hypothetical protein MUO19_03465 [Dehalococcoidales bacterium]|nr:hypothetical protein [Dehalococcoidales bacterium]